MIINNQKLVYIVFLNDEQARWKFLTIENPLVTDDPHAVDCQ